MADAPVPPNKARRWSVVALVVLTSLATFASTVGVWSHQVLLNTDEWVETVGPLAADEELTDAIAVFLVDELVDTLDLETVIADALPERIAGFAAPLTASMRSFVTEQTEKVLESDRFQTAWVEANRFAHRQAVRMLRGDQGVVTNQDGQIVLNLLPTLSQILLKIDSFGILPAKWDIPEIDRTMPPDEAIAALSEGTGRDLPDGFGQIVAFESDTLSEAQDAVKLFDRAVYVLVATTIVMGLAAIALSYDRRRTVVQLTFSVVVAIVASNAIIDATSEHLIGLIGDETNRSAAQVVVSGIFNSLSSIQRWITVGGLLLAFIAFASGSGSGAQRVRSFGRPRSVVEAESPVDTMDTTFVARNRDGLQVLGVVASLAYMAFAPVTFASLAVMLGLLAAYQGLVIAFAHRGTASLST